MKFLKFPFFLSAFLFFSVASACLFDIHYNTSASVPLGFYQRINAPIAKNDYIEICPPLREPFLTARQNGYIKFGSCPKHYRYLLKKVAALKGDNISATDHGIIVNGQKIADSKPLERDRYNRSFPKWRIKNYTLKDNEILLIGENPASYDGRYFGLLNLSDVLSVMKPIWIWN